MGNSCGKVQQLTYLLDHDSTLYADFFGCFEKCEDFEGHDFGRISL